MSRIGTALATSLGVAGAALAVDHASKSWIREHVEEGAKGPQLGPLTTSRVEHRVGEGTNVTDASLDTSRNMLAVGAPLGLALGLGAGLLPGRAGIAGAVSGGLLAAAAIGNGAEMLVRGSVTDFIDLPPGRPELVANVADLALIAGVVGLIAAPVGFIAFGKAPAVRALAT